MDTLDLFYDNMVDFLVLHSGSSFETPEGIQTGKQILKRLWMPYAPSDKIALTKLNKLQEKQRELLSTRRVKLDELENEIMIADDTETNWLEMGMRLA
jgi:hypothetical protein